MMPATSESVSMVSVVIPTWDRKDDLMRCLASVRRQDYRNMEIVVVDNGSKDGSGDMVTREFPSVRLLRNERNEGAARARNQGVACSRGLYLWFLDSDTEVVNSDTLSELVRVLSNDSRIGSVGGEHRRGVGFDEKVLVYSVHRGGWCTFDEIRRETPGMVECDYNSTANCLVRREVLMMVGGFDEAYGYLMEDVHLCRAMSALGYRNVVWPLASCCHHVSPRARMSGFLRQQVNRVRFVFLTGALGECLFLPVWDCRHIAEKALRGVRATDRASYPEWALAKPSRVSGGVKRTRQLCRYTFAACCFVTAVVMAYGINALRMSSILRSRRQARQRRLSTSDDK